MVAAVDVVCFVCVVSDGDERFFQVIQSFQVDSFSQVCFTVAIPSNNVNGYFFVTVTRVLVVLCAVYARLVLARLDLSGCRR